MKFNQLILLAAILIFIQGCSQNSENSNLDSEEFEFTLNGAVSNGEGLSVELASPENIDERLTSKIENGKFTLKGRANRIKPAAISIQGSRSFGTVLIEPGSISFKFDVQGDSPDYHFSKPEILEGLNNELFFDVANEIEEATEGRDMVFGDSIKMDSMRKYVYPDLRNQIFKVYEKQFDKLPPELKLILLSFITDPLTQIGAFDKNYLNKTEIKTI
ncbi:MAG: DUF4369 domain-containing protein, partial [Bacteroidetes bacterium]|nr:DUF4369 domain-containing protein [Bacteroidota bacterium]